MNGLAFWFVSCALLVAIVSPILLTLYGRRDVTYRYAREGMLRTAQLYLLIAAVVRGVDYLSRPPASAPALSYVEGSAPLAVWGGLFIAFGVLGLCGEAWMRWGQSDNRWLPSWAAHSALVGLYAVFSLSALLPVVEQGWGFSGPFEWLGYSVGHLVFVGRRKRVPAA